MYETTTQIPTLAVLEPFFEAATAHASATMARWTDGRIRMTLDKVCEVPLECVASELGMNSDLLTMVVIDQLQAPGGRLILTFDDAGGRRLAGMLLARETGETPEWSELEKSALMETGNILGSAYLNELTRLVGQPMTPSPPFFLQDFGACVLEEALMAQAMVSDRILICHTRFELDNEKLEWNVIFVPTPELLALIEANVPSTT